ncbi:hypothetical protein [Chryseobacterium lathyri]|uniref:hypothetical protein n=1 Tax=Chryseobacterium lathyri TaxID=395933 RepID=UPI001CBC7CBC|nr:hypothetical protein [Chryseobacterium lathyri]
MKMLVIFLCIIFYSCSNPGSPMPLDQNFIKADRKRELVFSKLVGKYELDYISKKRYNIPVNQSIIIEIHSDTTITANNYIDISTSKLKGMNYKNKLFYINNYKDKYPIINLSVSNKPYFNGGGSIDIYYRRQDNNLALYVSTPFIPATKENNYKYREGDYLRYIKVK